MTQTSADREEWLLQIEKSIQVKAGDRWKSERWSEFLKEVAWWLHNEMEQDDDDTIDAAVGLIKYGIKKEEQLIRVADNKKDFRESLKQEGVLAAICDELFSKYVAQQQQQQQQHALLSEDTVAALAAFAKEYTEKNQTIVLSEASLGSKHALLSMFLELPEKAAPWPNLPSNSTLPEFPVFHWHDSNDDSLENRKAYMHHLQENIHLPDNYVFGDVQPIRSLLDVELEGVDSETRRLRGTTDVVVTKFENIQHNTIRNSVDAQLELKKPTHLARKDHSPQVIAEHFAASYLNPTRAIFSVLTDLNSSWTFYWFADCEDALGGVALYRHVLQGTAPAAAAKYILENTLDGESSSRTHQSTTTTFPTTFSSRLSFEDFMLKLDQARRAKRLRSGSHTGPGNAGGSTGYQSHDETQDADGDHQEPPSELSTPGGQNQASDNNVREFPNQGEGKKKCMGGQGPMGAAEFLRSLAPQYNNDVADQLDLLDMVDEGEQYEIVRSFAANHIVPRMVGKRC